MPRLIHTICLCLHILTVTSLIRPRRSSATCGGDNKHSCRNKTTKCSTVSKNGLPSKSRCGVGKRYIWLGATGSSPKLKTRTTTPDFIFSLPPLCFHRNLRTGGEQLKRRVCQPAWPPCMQSQPRLQMGGGVTGWWRVGAGTPTSKSRKIEVHKQRRTPKVALSTAAVPTINVAPAGRG